MQHEQIAWRVRYDGISTPLIVAEFDQRRAVIDHFNDCANLAARKSGFWQIGKKRYGMKN